MDERPTRPPNFEMPVLVRIAGLGIAASALLPFSPTGLPFWRLVLEAFEQSAVAGLMVLFGYGAPFWFGLALALAPKGGRELDATPAATADAPESDVGASDAEDGFDAVSASSGMGAELWRRMAHGLLSLLHAQLVLTAWVVARAGVGIAAWPLFGFAVVSGFHFASQSGRMSAESEKLAGAPPPAWWLARWGAVMIVGIAGWLRLQSLVGLGLGFAVEAAGLCGMLVAWRLTLRRR